MLTAWIFLALLGLFDPPEPRWEWPTSGPARILRDFDAPESPWGAGHRGLDVAAGPRNELIAPVDARVWFHGEVVSREVLTLITRDGLMISFEPVSSDREAGDRVRRGEVIGEIDSGHCAQTCLHIGLRVDGEYRSPALELGVWRPSILLPDE